MSSNSNNGAVSLRCKVCTCHWIPHTAPDPLRRSESSICPSCVYIDLARRHANQQGISLRKAVSGYLNGTQRLYQTTLEHLWKET